MMINPFVFAKPKLSDVLTAQGLTSSVLCALDAGDSASYDGSSQTWTDVSGAGHHFYRGTGSGSDAADPTFSGTAGGLSYAEYFSFDGADQFSIITDSASWDFHLDSAQFTLAAWLWVPNLTTDSVIFGNGPASDEGMRWTLDSGERMNIVVQQNGGSAALALGATAAGVISRWNFYAITIDEAAGAGGSTWYTNGSTETFDGTYTSPSATTSGDKARIGAYATSSLPLESATRIAMFAAWTRDLSAAELGKLYGATRGRFGV